MKKTLINNVQSIKSLYEGDQVVHRLDLESGLLTEVNIASIEDYFEYSKTLQGDRATYCIILGWGGGDFATIDEVTSGIDGGSPKAVLVAYNDGGIILLSSRLEAEGVPSEWWTPFLPR